MNTNTDPKTDKPRTTAAEVVFVELDPHWERVAVGRLPMGRWNARLLDPATASGTVLGRPVSQSTMGRLLTIRETVEMWADGEHTIYRWTTPGATTYNGNRHGATESLSEAQAAVIKWASRRFRVEVPR